MNKNKIVMLTNWIALISVVFLIYWVFIFVSVTIFGFKVFQENLTEGFYLSILGIFALLGGAIILNIMMNMTLISEHIGKRASSDNFKNIRYSKPVLYGGLVLFPIIFILLYFGDNLSTIKKKNMLVESTVSIVEEYNETIKTFANYSFSKDFIEKTANSLKVLSGVDKNFPNISLIIHDEISKKPILLKFTPYFHHSEKVPKKEDFIFSTSLKEREYLNNVFDEKTLETHFSAHNGRYELYYPIKIENKVIILYLSDYQRYGKIGS